MFFRRESASRREVDPHFASLQMQLGRLAPVNDFIGVTRVAGQLPDDLSGYSSVEILRTRKKPRRWSRQREPKYNTVITFEVRGEATSHVMAFSPEVTSTQGIIIGAMPTADLRDMQKLGSSTTEATRDQSPQPGQVEDIADRLRRQEDAVALFTQILSHVDESTLRPVQTWSTLEAISLGNDFEAISAPYIDLLLAKASKDPSLPIKTLDAKGKEKQGIFPGLGLLFLATQVTRRIQSVNVLLVDPKDLFSVEDSIPYRHFSWIRGGRSVRVKMQTGMTSREDLERDISKPPMATEGQFTAEHSTDLFEALRKAARIVQ